MATFRVKYSYNNKDAPGDINYCVNYFNVVIAENYCSESRALSELRRILSSISPNVDTSTIVILDIDEY